MRSPTICSSLHSALFFILILATTFGGRRFIVEDGIIQEKQVVKNGQEWIKELEMECTADNHQGISYAHRILLEKLLQTTSNHNDLSPGIDTKSFSLVQLSPTSLFCISKQGKIYERFFNGVKWVYIPHLISPQTTFTKRLSNNKWEYISQPHSSLELAVQVTSILSGNQFINNNLINNNFLQQHQEFHGYRGIVISDENGKLFQREPSETGNLFWVDISIEAIQVFSGGICGAKRSFFVSSSGDLYERNFEANIWIQHPLPPGNSISIILDVFTLVSKSIFVLNREGVLWEYTQELWIRHGIPPQGKLALKPAVVLRDLNAVGSLFLLSSGTLVEYWWNPNLQKWQWVPHGTPPGETLSGAPGALIERKRMFMVTSSRNLVERQWNSTNWVWINHNAPLDNGPLAITRPVALGHPWTPMQVLTYLENGLLVALEMMNQNWEWQVIDVPEDGNASYCSPILGIENSCQNAIL